MRDIKRIKELGFNNFFLIDDNIVSSPKYLMELARRITPLKMSWASQCSLDLAKHPKLLKAVAKSGCKILSFGLESITQEGLDKLNKEWVKVDNHEVLLKRINDAGIMISSEMIIGTDSDTEESIRETYKFIDRLKIQAPRFWILAPIPGTTMYKNYKKQNRLLSEDFKIYGQTCVYNPEKISAETVDRMYWWLYKKVFSIPCIIRRVLLRREFVKNPIIYLSLFIANLHYRGYVLREIPPVVF